MNNLRLISCLLVALTLSSARAADKPKLTIDEFFNSVSFTAVKLSPDGRALVIGTERADWDKEIFRKDLWIYRDDSPGGGTLTQLTQSGHDTQPQWSPDGRWIAFLSERKMASSKEDDSGQSGDKEIKQLYLISPAGGEAFPVTQGDEEVHALAWSPDSRALYFATRTPWSKAQQDAYKKQWKDVVQYRAAERGDMIFSINVAEAVARHTTAGNKAPDDSDRLPDTTPGTRTLASTPWKIQQLEASPDGRRLAFVTTSVSERWEKIEEFEIYSVDLANTAPDGPPGRLTNNQAVEHEIRWADDSKHVFFLIEVGSAEGKYKDTQPRLYWVDADTGDVQRWAAGFEGAVAGYALAPEGGVLAAGQLGIEVQLYSQPRLSAKFSVHGGWAGTYHSIATASHSPGIAFVHSSWESPAEVYLAESVEKLQQARPVTAFNKLFTERDLPKAKPYRWTADDGTAVEGMLVYPPGKFGAKNLPMFVFIHGGPADADGNHFETDWYQWDRLAATQGWLVFEPNYRGSTGYGDKFLQQIVPEIVSRPGKDILQGVGALVRDGIADPNHLTIGGYSYGGYMTNWLITQTTRFKAAVTGAGAVEHVANWGNDDTAFDDAYFLGGLPWEAQQRYHDEAAMFQINKVRTPTHMVAGADDIRVAVGEDYLLDHALHNLGVPSTLLIFPGEGHSLAKNPWHGKIKVREELKWLERYGGLTAGAQGIEITLEHNSPGEKATQEQLERLLTRYDLTPYTFTHDVVIDDNAIPHSHPVLTLHTRHLSSDDQLLSTYVHEQLHWFLEGKPVETRGAMEELKRVFPKVPIGFPEGADSEESTYEHLIVCFLESEAMRILVGERRAAEVMEFWAGDHYRWIYRTVVGRRNDVAAILPRRGLTLPHS